VSFARDRDRAGAVSVHPDRQSLPAVFSSMIGVTVFGLIYTPATFYVIFALGLRSQGVIASRPVRSRGQPRNNLVWFGLEVPFP
jgi:hypothetical protein